MAELLPNGNYFLNIYKHNIDLWIIIWYYCIRSFLTRCYLSGRRFTFRCRMLAFENFRNLCEEVIQWKINGKVLKMFSDIIAAISNLVGVISIIVTCYNTYITLKRDNKHQKSNRSDQE